MARKIVSGIITVIAILAMGVTAFAEDPGKVQKKLVPMQKDIQQQATQPAMIATISGTITLYDVQIYLDAFKSANCSDVTVQVGRYSDPTPPYEPNLPSEILLTTKATGGQIINGCSYSVKVKKGPATWVSAKYLGNQLPKKGRMDGFSGYFDLKTNMTKNIVMMYTMY